MAIGSVESGKTILWVRKNVAVVSVCVCVVVSEFVLRPYSIRHEVGEKEQSNNSNGGQTSARERLSENEKS